MNTEKIRVIKESDIPALIEYLKNEQFENCGHLDMNDMWVKLPKFLTEVEIVVPVDVVL